MMRKKSVTIKDIADRLDLAVSTVSYAINNGPRSVSEDVRIRVSEVAKELGYRAPKLQRQKAPGLTHHIAVIAQIRTGFFISPYTATINSSLLCEAQAAGYDLSFITRGPESRREELLDSLLSGRYDAAIVLDGVPQATIRRIFDSGLPMLAISNETPTEGCRYEIDNEHGLRQGLGHLYALGHRDIAYFHGPLDLHDGRDRLRVFKTFVAERGLSIPNDWILNGAFRFQSSYQAAHRLLAGRRMPTAIAAGNDESAAGIVAALSECGLRVPNDVSVVGFDDLPFVGASLASLTTVRQPIAEIGATAIRAICGALEDQHPIVSRKFPTELVVRMTTSAPNKEQISR